MKDIDNNLDSLEMFNTFLNIMNIFQSSSQQTDLNRIESKLDLILQSLNKEQEDSNGIDSRKS